MGEWHTDRIRDLVMRLAARQATKQEALLALVWAMAELDRREAEVDRLRSERDVLAAAAKAQADAWDAARPGDGEHRVDDDAWQGATSHVESLGRLLGRRSVP